MKYLFQEIEQALRKPTVLLAPLGSLRGILLGASACEDAIEAIVILMARVLVEPAGRDKLIETTTESLCSRGV